MEWLTYRGIEFDAFEKDDDFGYWAEMCEECVNKYQDLISEDIDDGGTARGYCSVMGCLNRGNTEKKHYYIDFKPEYVNFKTKGKKHND